MRSRSLVLLLLALLITLPACSSGLLPRVVRRVLPGNVAAPGATLTYEGPLTLSIKNGQPLAGTNLGYQGESADGRALLLIGGQQAVKQLADSVNYSGTILPGSTMNLNMRVGPYDQTAVNLIGTVRVEIQDPKPSASEPSQDAITGYSIPVQYRVNRGDAIPGTVVQYLGSTPQGAQFSNISEYPYKSQFDSVVWSGHIRDKIGIKLDLRLLNYSDSNAALVGTAQLRFEK